MITKQIVHIGVDVSKDSLYFDGNPLFAKEIPNNASKIRSTLKQFQKKANKENTLHVCLESTGTYGDELVSECHKANIRVSVLNPAKVRYFAKAFSESAKTDPIDARVIRCFSEKRKPEPALPPSKTQIALRKLILTRDAITKSVVQLKGTLESVQGSEAGKRLEKTIKSLEKEVETLEAKMNETSKTDTYISGLSKELTTITGIGHLTAIKIVVLVPELGTLGRRRAAGLAGLAPYVQDSGKYKGLRKIGGGRAEVRHTLYMPAISAIAHNPVLKPVYRNLKERGKLHKVAITAVMRKLFCHMDSVAARWIEKQSTVSAIQSLPLT